MLELLWTATKAFGRFIKIHFPEIILMVLSFYILGIFSDMKAEIKKIQRQNFQAYNVQAELNSKIIETLVQLIAYTQQIEKANIQRAVTLADFLKDLDAKIQASEDKIKADEQLSLTRDTAIAGAFQNYAMKPTYDYMKSRIVYLVQTYENADMMSIGTGTVIKVTDTETYILTNKHVCDFAEGSVCFVYQDKEKYVITLVKQNEVDHDIQIVKTSKVVPGKQAVIGIKDVQPQDKVFMTGHNNGNPFLYSEGTVSGFDRRSGDLIVGMPSGPGNSGSGIFTQDGYLTGILYAGQMFPAVPFGAAMDTAHGICVNSQVLRLFLSEYFE